MALTKYVEKASGEEVPRVSTSGSYRLTHAICIPSASLRIHTLMTWAGAPWMKEEVVLYLIRWDERASRLPPINGNKAGPLRVTVVGGVEEMHRSLSLPMCAGEEDVLKAIARLAESQPVKKGKWRAHFHPPSRFKSSGVSRPNSTQRR